MTGNLRSVSGVKMPLNVITIWNIFLQKLKGNGGLLSFFFFRKLLLKKLND